MRKAEREFVERVMFDAEQLGISVANEYRRIMLDLWFGNDREDAFPGLSIPGVSVDGKDFERELQERVEELRNAVAEIVRITAPYYSGRKNVSDLRTISQVQDLLIDINNIAHKALWPPTEEKEDDK